jgi:hypothetical protein
MILILVLTEAFPKPLLKKCSIVVAASYGNSAAFGFISLEVPIAVSVSDLF